MLAFARVAGETAPLLFHRLRQSVLEPQNSTNPSPRCPCRFIVYAISPYDEWHRLAWAGSLVLIAMIMVSVTLVRIFATAAYSGGS